MAPIESKGDESRFTWDDPSLLSFTDCGTCRNKFPEDFGCKVYPDIIPINFRTPNVDKCPDYVRE